jgi:hypothetical protein
MAVTTKPLTPEPETFPGDPAGALEETYPNYPKNTNPDPGAVFAESSAPVPPSAPITPEVVDTAETAVI